MKYILAKSAAEALEALLAEEGKARIIAGGSDVMVDMEAGKLAPQTLVDITTADDMKGIRIQDDQLIIGAAVTLTEIARSPLIRQYFPSLCKGAGSVGSLQIRNSATLVGNVVTAQPAADAAMAVAPLDPRFVVLSKDGIRELAMGEMYAGFGKSTLNSTAEVVKEIHIPLPAELVAAFYANSLSNLLQMWIQSNNQQCTAENMVEAYAYLLSHRIQDFIDPTENPAEN